MALILLLTVHSVHAEFGVPYVTPDQPSAGQIISVNIHQGGCDAISGIPGYPQITQTGNAVRVLFNGVRYTDPELCYLGYGTATYAVAAYAPGAYTLQVDLRYSNGGGDFVIDTLGMVPFTVTGSDPNPVAAPAFTAIGLAVLMVLMTLAALLAFRTHR